jgi:YD repeat-containing protein
MFGDEFNDTPNANVFERSVVVIDPGGGTNIYMLRQDSSKVFTNTIDVTNATAYYNDLASNNYDAFLPLVYSTGVPSGGSLFTVDNNFIYYRDSFHWGPLQANGLPTNLYSFTPAIFIKARMQHWLHDNSEGFLSQTIDMEQEPSPDGVTPGQTMWYNYDGQGYLYFQGAESLPSFISRVIPDGTPWFRWYQRDQWGRPTNISETYSMYFGQTPLLRSNIYVYGANGIDLIKHIGPTGNIDDGWFYNVNHEVAYYTNAVGYITTNSYDAQWRLTGTQSPAGLTTTNIYFSSGSTNWVQTKIDLQINRTNSYTYSSNLVSAHTDERGLTTHYFYDNLGRLIETSNSLGAFTYNYNKLDLVSVIDPMGFSNCFGYDSVRRKIASTNALGEYTLY